MANKNKCIYCNAESYGPGCPYSPHGKHVHQGDPKKCIYCGSASMGPGCPYNPFNSNHVHGVEYNTMIRDSVEKTITAGYLINKISEDVEETNAYKLGIVNKDGIKIKKPETLEEKASYTTLDAYVFNLKHAAGSQIELLNGAIYLEKQDEVAMEDYAQLYEKELQAKKHIKRLVKEFKQTVDQSYQKGLSTTTIEKIILETFLEEK